MLENKPKPAEPKSTTSDPPILQLLPGGLVTDRVGMAFLGVGRTKFWSLVKDGTLRPVKFGQRCTRFRADEILSLING